MLVSQLYIELRSKLYHKRWPVLQYMENERKLILHQYTPWQIGRGNREIMYKRAKPLPSITYPKQDSWWIVRGSLTSTGVILKLINQGFYPFVLQICLIHLVHAYIGAKEDPVQMHSWLGHKDTWSDLLGINRIEPVKQSQNLYSTESVQNVGIVVVVSSKTSCNTKIFV